MLCLAIFALLFPLISSIIPDDVTSTLTHWTHNPMVLDIPNIPPCHSYDQINENLYKDLVMITLYEHDIIVNNLPAITIDAREETTQCTVYFMGAQERNPSIERRLGIISDSDADDMARRFSALNLSQIQKMTSRKEEFSSAPIYDCQWTGTRFLVYKRLSIHSISINLEDRLKYEFDANRNCSISSLYCRISRSKIVIPLMTELQRNDRINGLHLSNIDKCKTATKTFSVPGVVYYMFNKLDTRANWIVEIPELQITLQVNPENANTCEGLTVTEGNHIIDIALIHGNASHVRVNKSDLAYFNLIEEMTSSAQMSSCESKKGPNFCPHDSKIYIQGSKERSRKYMKEHHHVSHDGFDMNHLAYVTEKLFEEQTKFEDSQWNERCEELTNILANIGQKQEAPDRLAMFLLGRGDVIAKIEANKLIVHTTTPVSQVEFNQLTFNSECLIYVNYSSMGEDMSLGLLNTLTRVISPHLPHTTNSSVCSPPPIAINPTTLWNITSGQYIQVKSLKSKHLKLRPSLLPGIGDIRVRNDDPLKNSPMNSHFQDLLETSLNAGESSFSLEAMSAGIRGISYIAGGSTHFLFWTVLAIIGFLVLMSLLRFCCGLISLNKE